MKRVHITNEGQAAWLTKITDAETGEDIPNVQRVDLSFDCRAKEAPIAIIYSMLPKVDVVVNAQVRHVCPYCGREE